MQYLSDRETDKALMYLEKRIQHEYNKAGKEIAITASNYFSDFEKRYEEEYKAYKRGVYTKKQFEDWYITQVGRGRKYERMRDECARRITEADKVAAAYISDGTASICALNRNYEAYQIAMNHNGVVFDIWDEQTVKNLIGHKKIQLPLPKINIPKADRWNRQRLQSALLSAIIQGQSVSDLADTFNRIARMGSKSAIRNARTAYTGAQNAGRQKSYEKAHEMGIQMQKEWISTLDAYTRPSHQQMDGVVVDYDEQFPNGLMYPADPSGEPAEIYNCRCTMRAKFEKINQYRETYKEWEARMNGANN